MKITTLPILALVIVLVATFIFMTAPVEKKEVSCYDNHGSVIEGLTCKSSTVVYSARLIYGIALTLAVCLTFLNFWLVITGYFDE